MLNDRLNDKLNDKLNDESDQKLNDLNDQCENNFGDEFKPKNFHEKAKKVKNDQKVAQNKEKNVRFVTNHVKLITKELTRNESQKFDDNSIEKNCIDCQTTTKIEKKQGSKQSDLSIKNQRLFDALRKNIIRRQKKMYTL